VFSCRIFAYSCLILWHLTAALLFYDDKIVKMVSHFDTIICSRLYRMTFVLFAAAGQGLCLKLRLHLQHVARNMLLKTTWPAALKMLPDTRSMLRVARNMLPVTWSMLSASRNMLPLAWIRQHVSGSRQHASRNRQHVMSSRQLVAWNMLPATRSLLPATWSMLLVAAKIIYFFPPCWIFFVNTNFGG